MGIINRFLLFFYVLAIGILSLGVAAACLKILPEHIWLNELQYAFLQQEAMTAAAVIAAMSLYFAGYCLFSGSSSEAAAPSDSIVVKNETGEVRVSVDAVRNIVEREARVVRSVRDVKVRVKPSGTPGENPLQVEVRLVLLSGANVPQVSDEVIRNIKTQLRQSMDFPDVPVKVTVSDVSNAPVENRRRVV